MKKLLVIGSRGSDLALWQANFVKAELLKAGIKSEIKVIKTQGDQIQHLSFDKMEGKGFFTKEIEEALLNNDIDVAVHSHKDLPTISPKGLVVAAVSKREDPCELLLINKNAVDFTQQFSLKKQATVGTSSARRKSQLLSFRNDIELRELRGNVPTRVDKLRKGSYDAILLAAAGVERLGLNLSEFHVEKLNPFEFVPAPAQGVLAVQIRTEDIELFQRLQAIHHPDVAATIAIERKILNLFDGGCQLPLGAYCRKEDDFFEVWAAKADDWSKFPKNIYYKTKEIIGLAEKVVAKINQNKPRRVFITGDLSQKFYMQKALSVHGYEITGHSLIETKPVFFTSIPKVDWVFFSSKNAVKYFFSQNPKMPAECRYAAIGKSTSQALREHNIISGFTGDSIHTRQVGKAFAEMADGQSVLFPMAANSLQSIQHEISHRCSVYNLTVYKTLAKIDCQIPDFDIIIFTSPSNVESFFSKHTISPQHEVIAIGSTTGKKLESFGVVNFELPYLPNEVALTAAVFSL